MKPAAFGMLHLVCLLLGSARATLAEDDSSVAVTDLVVGDSYTIRVERSGVVESFSGALVKANAEWIVLERELEGRNEQGIPSSKLGFFNRTFKNVGIGREHDVVWLPREAATVEQRTMSAKRAELAEVATDEPPTNSFCRIQYADGAETKSISGELSSQDETDLTVSSEVMVEERQGVPLLSDIPLVGRAFTRKTQVSQHRSHKFARDDVLAVRIELE